MHSWSVSDTIHPDGRGGSVEAHVGTEADDDPLAVELNVDAALMLRTVVGIDSYPPVLALMPNIYLVEDRKRVHEVVGAQLAEVGVLVDGRVHPTVAHWLHCLNRPDMEMAARILDTGLGGEARGLLRISFVRAGADHVLALRNDDHVVLQTVFQQGRELDNLAAVLISALGSVAALEFEPMSATFEQLNEVPADPVERRAALVELGAQPRTAAALTRALDQVVRRAEVQVIEHHDGGSVVPEVALSILDTLSGRVVVTPSRAMDGEMWSTYLPGDDAAIQRGMSALIDLLPARSWFETSRTD